MTLHTLSWPDKYLLGWYPISIACLVLSACLALFPRSLPRAAELRKNTNTPLPQCKSLSVPGTIGIISSAMGILIGGVVISKFKPSSRYLASWNVFTLFLQVIGYASYIFMSCPDQQYHGHWDNNHMWNLTESCNAQFNCGNDIQFAPVCDTSTRTAFYSSCHAGCNSTSFINGTLEYRGCTCVPNSGKVLDGLCPADCSFNILLFMSVMGFLSFTSATGGLFNKLLQFRCVDEEDKSLSMGVCATLVALFAHIPAPILFGFIMDTTCIVWGDSCGARGNCWIYDGFKLRAAYNITAATFLLIGAFFKCFVWYYSKGLKIYDEDFSHDK